MFKDKYLISIFGLKRRSVYIQCHLGEIGIGFYGSVFPCPAGVSPAAEVYKRFSAPIGFINIEGIFFDFAVHGHKALIIASRCAAFVPGSASEVEHIPHMG